jgi:hypothetical protein
MWRYYILECKDSDTDLPHVDEAWSEDGSASQKKKKKGNFVPNGYKHT